MTSVIAKELTIGQLAQRSGVAPSALRFYEEQGLISSRRTSGNQRRYPRDMLRRVAFIRVSQNVGMPLGVIREALERLPEGRTPTRDDWARVSAGWRADLDARIRRMVRLRDGLTDCIGCGCLSLESCMLANPYDVLAESGGCGPIRLQEDGTCAPCDGDHAEKCADPGATVRETVRP
ncbi:redox-sensitive transcriptional activator SoxR [Streptomyces sp. RFCAC02]|uniref:redox-sensitive transcriptional activator SoxR n=1 Tax=Streptomyces sp. RFCAC02 TaxID=2499143 RepID=UPI001020407B|nr:redox-sensitive transcriptional activator SoxR [Streptomyces sp. RFCAC02]